MDCCCFRRRLWICVNKKRNPRVAAFSPSICDFLIQTVLRKSDLKYPCCHLCTQIDSFQTLTMFCVISFELVDLLLSLFVASSWDLTGLLSACLDLRPPRSGVKCGYKEPAVPLLPSCLRVGWLMSWLNSEGDWSIISIIRLPLAQYGVVLLLLCAEFKPLYRTRVRSPARGWHT